MRPDGSDQQNLSQHPASDYTPGWSPDGQWILFVSGRDTNLEIYRMRPDGSDQENITQNTAWDENPQWSVASPLPFHPLPGLGLAGLSMLGGIFLFHKSSPKPQAPS
jgi:hypothetical protein